MSSPKTSAARPSASAFRPPGTPATGGCFDGCRATFSVHEQAMPSQKRLRMAQLAKQPTLPALVSHGMNSEYGKGNVTALGGQRTAHNECKLPSIFEEFSDLRNKSFQGLQDLRSGRAMLEHTQGSSGIKLIKRYPGIEVIGIEMNSGSLPDHQQQGRHSAQLENRGKTKKQRCSLNSSANEGGKSLGGMDLTAGLSQAFFDPNSVAAAQHSPCYSSSSHYAPFAQDSSHGSTGQQAAHPPPPYQTSTPPLHPTHQSAFLDWTASPPPLGQGATPQLPSNNLFPDMRGFGGSPPVAIKQEEIEFQTGFMPDSHHAAGRPGNPSSVANSADACSPCLYAADAYTASRRQGATAELNGLLHGDSGISAGSQILLDMDLRPRNVTPTSRWDDPLKVPSPSAHAELHAPMTQGLKKRRGATAAKPSAAAGQSPMTHGLKNKKKGSRAALASLQSPAAEPRGTKRKGEQWEENLEDAAAVISGLDDVLFELGDDMEIDGGLADLTAADMPPHMHGSIPAAPQPAGAAQLMQSAAAAPPVFTAHPRGSRSPAVQRDVHAAAVVGGLGQQESQRQGRAARAASGGSRSTANQPAMPSISAVMPSASMGGPSADQSAASASPSAAASYVGQGSAAAAQTGPPGTLRGRGQAMSKVARRVKGDCPKETWEYEEGEMVWAQSRGHPWWPAMVRQPTKKQEQATRMTDTKVFVEYYGTMEIEALTQRCVLPWNAMIPPTAPQGSLKVAVDLAKDFMHNSTLV